MLILALALNLFQAHAQVLASPWNVLREEVLPAAGNPAHRQLPVTLIVEAGSKWDNRTVLLQTLSKTSTILGVCGISIGEAQVQTVVWQEGLMHRLENASPYNPPADLELVQGELPVTKPIAFLIGKGIYQTAKAANRKYTDAYKRMFPQADIEKLFGSIIMTEQYISNTPVPYATATYNTFAHEMVHILANTGHVMIRRNLMSEFEGRGMQTGDLTPEQCSAMASFGEPEADAP